jgi:hypothetical protein
LLSGFDPDLESRLLQFFEVISKTDAEYTAGRFAHLFDDPLLRYYLALAISFLIAGDCPEERQRGLLGTVADRLLNARKRAEDVFEPELASAGEVASTFQWTKEPGPFERQLQRQQNNPLFPARARAVSAQQVTDARLADLKLMSDFMSIYRPIVRKILSGCGKTVREATDFEKEIIDLIPSCMSLGDYFSSELESLTKFSEIIQQEVIATTKEAGLQNTYERYMALTRIQGYLRILGTALPSADGTEDYSVRSILSEGLGAISDFSTDFHSSFESHPSRKPFPQANLNPHCVSLSPSLPPKLTLLTVSPATSAPRETPAGFPALHLAPGRARCTVFPVPPTLASPQLVLPGPGPDSSSEDPRRADYSARRAPPPLGHPPRCTLPLRPGWPVLSAAI